MPDVETRQRLERFLKRHGLVSGPIEMRLIGDGHSNLTYWVGDGETALVVRRPPAPPLPVGAHDVLREARLLQALSETTVPVPKVFAVGDAGAVFDVPFYVMEFKRGVVFTARTPAPLDNGDLRALMAMDFIDRLADLHSVDWRACGLSDFGRPEGFNQRHLHRIRQLVKNQQTIHADPFAVLYDWLEEHVPPESGASIIHNDYRIGNVMWAETPPAKLIAIFDWELATIGDPLIDIGYLMISYPDPSEPMTPTHDLSLALLEPGYPSRAKLLERYSQRTGRSLEAIKWYTVMNGWKLAALYDYSRRQGRDRYYADPQLVSRFLAHAAWQAGLILPN